MCALEALEYPLAGSTHVTQFRRGEPRYVEGSPLRGVGRFDLLTARIRPDAEQLEIVHLVEVLAHRLDAISQRWNVIRWRFARRSSGGSREPLPASLAGDASPRQPI